MTSTTPEQRERLAGLRDWVGLDTPDAEALHTLLDEHEELTTKLRLEKSLSEDRKVRVLALYEMLEGRRIERDALDEDRSKLRRQLDEALDEIERLKSQLGPRTCARHGCNERVPAARTQRLGGASTPSGDGSPDV